MKITQISPTLFANTTKQINNKKQSKQQQNINYSYNPIAYQDYNLNFTARLFRTPANFYEQSFNRNGMPDTMKNYLFDDYEDRQNIPPAQMMKIVFGDLKYADTLEDVKILFPDEPLFENLKDVSGKKARTSVIAEIELMKQEDKPLFKNGKDNLGLYLLKKIYLEGKSLKEINKDFEKDISVYYKGLSPIKYETLAAYGIKYPNNAFWQSFTATREDFPYEYKPRKALNNTQTSERHALPTSQPKPHVQKPKFSDIKDWEIDKIADAFTKGHGSTEETKRQIKRHGLKDTESLNFVAKYLGEINAIVLDRLHVSEDMKAYFENPDNISETQQKKFEQYWKNPDLNKLQSTLMSDTIKLFFLTYGVDGNNDDFRELLDYAHSIKPTRLEQQKRHDELQADYENTLALYEDEPAETPTVAEEVTPKEDPNKFMVAIDQKNHKLVVRGDLKKVFAESVMPEFKFLPEAYSKKMIDHLLNHKDATEKYLVSMLADNNFPDEFKDLIYSPEEINKISLDINNDFSRRNPQAVISGNLAMLVVLLKHLDPADTKRSMALVELSTDRLVNLFENGGVSISPEEKAEINRLYADYMRPIKSKDEIQQINTILTEGFKNYKTNSKTKACDPKLAALEELLSANVSENPKIEKELKKFIRQSDFTSKYGGSLRVLLDENIPKELKEAKLQVIIDDFLVMNFDRMSKTTKILASNPDNLEKYMRPYFPEIYLGLKQRNFEITGK